MADLLKRVPRKNGVVVMQNNEFLSESETYIFNTESVPELFRTIKLDQTITKAMDGPLAEQKDLSALRQILDIACGAGGWALEVARDLPNVEVAGIDISRAMVDYAHARALSQGLYNASFEVMDALQPLEFSDNTFDLVNARYLTWFVPGKDWPRLLKECMRVLRPGGVLRITETDGGGMTNSPAYERLQAMTLQMIWQGGKFGFSPDGQRPWITHVLASLLRQAGYRGVRTKAHALDVSAKEEGWDCFYQQCVVIFTELRAAYIDNGLISEHEFDEIIRQVEVEILADNFSGVWYHLTAWGRKPIVHS